MSKSVLDEAKGMLATDDIARDILKILRDNGVPSFGPTEKVIMEQIMILITRRDNELTNYAYKLGRSSV